MAKGDKLPSETSSTRSGLLSSKRRRGGSLPRLSRGDFIGNPPATLLASETIAVAAIVAYDLMQNPGTKLPSPKAPIAALGFYSLLAIIGSLGENMARITSAVGGVLALTLVVTGKRGKGILGLLNKLTGLAK